MDLLILANTAFNKDFKHIFNAINKLDYNLVGFISLDGGRIFEEIEGYKIYPFNYIHILKYDFALVECYVDSAPAIVPYLVNAKIPLSKVRTIFWLVQQIMIKKYEDCQDSVIQETLAYWRTPREISVFNQHVDNSPHTFDEMFFDENCGLPYINFKTIEDKERRMYFPKNGGQRVQGPDGKFYITDILREQIPTSPHLYITGDHKVEEGDVLIDAGVCEGNFALRYADICSKIYLFEMEEKWFEPLYNTFRYCWDKVVLIPKAISDAKKWGGRRLMTLSKSLPVVKSSSKWMLKARSPRRSKAAKLL